jgi:hypothetical protein
MAGKVVHFEVRVVAELVRRPGRRPLPSSVAGEIVELVSRARWPS